MEKLVSKLRRDLTPHQLQAVLSSLGVSRSPPLKTPTSSKSDHLNEESNFNDLKTRISKEICFEIASNSFTNTQSEVQQKCLEKLQKLGETYKVKNPDFNPQKFYQKIAQDICDSTMSPTDEDEVNIKDKFAKNQSTDSEHMKEIKDNMSKLIDMFQSVKIDNENKEKEIKEMKNKMTELEKVISSKKNEEKVDDKLMRVEKEPKSLKDVSPRYIRSDDFSKPSPGVVVPPEIVDKDAQIAWLMENDVAFRRGRIRWEAQQKRHQANLRSQEINRQRRQKAFSEKRQNIQPRFAFRKSICENQSSKSSIESSEDQQKQRYFDAPRRKTFSSVHDLHPKDISQRSSLQYRNPLMIKDTEDENPNFRRNLSFVQPPCQYVPSQIQSSSSHNPLILPEMYFWPPENCSVRPQGINDLQIFQRPSNLPFQLPNCCMESNLAPMMTPPQMSSSSSHMIVGGPQHHLIPSNQYFYSDPHPHPPSHIFQNPLSSNDASCLNPRESPPYLSTSLSSPLKQEIKKDFESVEKKKLQKFYQPPFRRSNNFL